eukprot:m.85511 g.85511  ORF g.85511 m.85511 type:complete len:170 (+) comp21273_c0_seq4:19-528(+)
MTSGSQHHTTATAVISQLDCFLPQVSLFSAPRPTHAHTPHTSTYTHLSLLFFCSLHTNRPTNNQTSTNNTNNQPQNPRPHTAQQLRAFFSGFEQICLAEGGRPHWGKDFYLTSNELKDLFPKWNDFQAVRQIMDPDGIFMNDYLDRVLGSGSKVDEENDQETETKRDEL